MQFPFLPPRVFFALFALCASLSVSPASAGDLRLKDGSVLKGELLFSSDSVIVFRANNIGIVRISPDSLEGETPPSAEARPRRGGDRDPSSQALFFLPTAFNPPRNAVTFRDFEMLFLTFGYSPTSSTTLSAGFFFPISSRFQLLTAGFKQQLWKAKDGQTAAAVTGNFTRPIVDEADVAQYIVNSNLVLSRRFNRNGFTDAFGFHLAAGYAGLAYKEISLFSGDDERTRWVDNYSFGGGFEMRGGPNSKFMIEYLNSTPFDFTESGYGLLTLGIRLHGTRLSADIAGFRPVSPSSGDLFFWPLINIGYRF